MTKQEFQGSTRRRPDRRGRRTNMPLLRSEWTGNILVRQYETEGKARLTYNPDDDSFYIDIPLKEFPDEWETKHIYANSEKGWANAKYKYRKLIGESE